MARMARVVVPNFPHHVTQRGNRRQQTFFCADDYRAYLSLLAAAVEHAGVAVWAYCLMPNHVHLVVVPQQENSLRALFAEAHRRYTRHINFREGWRGHLWHERFHSFVLDEQYLLATVRYVELNPVRARLCTTAQEWPWSSAAAHLHGEDDLLVAVAPMLQRITDWNAYLSHAPTETAIDAIRHHNRSGRPAGNEQFITCLEQLAGRSLRRGKPGPAARDK